MDKEWWIKALVLSWFFATMISKQAKDGGRIQAIIMTLSFLLLIAIVVILIC